MTLDEFLHGRLGVTYNGLLPILSKRPLPPGTMTRQRRRAEQRAAEKAATPRSKV